MALGPKPTTSAIRGCTIAGSHIGGSLDGHCGAITASTQGRPQQRERSRCYEQPCNMSPGLLPEVYKRRKFAVLRLFSRRRAGTTRASGAVSVLRILRLDVHNASLDIGTILRTNVVLNGCGVRRTSGIRRGRRRMRDPASASRSRPPGAPVKLLLLSVSGETSERPSCAMTGHPRQVGSKMPQEEIVAELDR